MSAVRKPGKVDRSAHAEFLSFFLKEEKRPCPKTNPQLPGK